MEGIKSQENRLDIVVTINMSPESTGTTISAHSEDIEKLGDLALCPKDIYELEKGKVTESEENKTKVQEIKESMERGEKIDAIICRQYQGGYQVIDGHHRLAAYIERNEELKEDGKEEEMITVKLVPARYIKVIE
jgi:cell fate (sporulation/competence/biofilm development) regulator YlbF (YheA/YmcA/DUF963 family)